jgi:hypothetical protein
MRGRRLSAQDAVFRSGLASEVIGTFYWLPEGGVAFLGRLLQSRVCVPDAAAVRERPLSRPESVGRLTVLPVLRPSGS